MLLLETSQTGPGDDNPKIFISYRRTDAAYPAHANYDKLVERYGADSVVFDVDTIPLGIDFLEFLDEQVSQCDVLLAVIGDGWLDARSEDGTRRQDDPDDFVRIEIAAALQRNIPVIPVLTGQATMARKDELPALLQPLTRRNAAELRPGRDFHSHLDRLVRGLDQALGQVDKSLGTRESLRSVTGEVVSNSIGMQLRLVPAGEFMMGSPESDMDAHSDERPQHHVRITKGFYLSTYATTQGEYQHVMGDNPSNFNGNRRPVEDVKWCNAVDFCNKLSDVDGLDLYYKRDGHDVSIVGGTGYRLPTEAEWEYACRAQTITKWSCGSTANNVEAAGWFGKDWAAGTSRVGQKEANSWGLYDMHGNVWEWCWDRYDAEYYSQSPVDDPTGPATGSTRVLRGGSFYIEADRCRSAARFSWHIEDTEDSFGFRVARSCH